MKKIQFSRGNFNIEAVINELKCTPELKDKNINLDNLTEFMIYRQEKLINCRNCQGLENCLNHQQGYYQDYDEKEDTFKLISCEKLEAFQLLNKQKANFRNLYMPKSVLEAELASFRLDTKKRQEAIKIVTLFLSQYHDGTKKENKMVKPNGIIIKGDVETGKTYLMSGISKELARKGLKTLMVYFPDLIREMKNSMGINDKFSNLINDLKETDVLLLDNFGSIELTKWIRDEILEPIMYYRFSEGLPIIMTTNLDISGLHEYLLVAKPTEYDMQKRKSIFQKILKNCEMVDL